MASAYEARRDGPTITRRRHVLACARCRARRVKCDRAQPTCSNCSKAGAVCKAVQQPGLSIGNVPSRPGSREPVERSRLLKLEEEVARLSREVDSKSPSREPSYSPTPMDAGAHGLSANVGRLVDSRTPGYLSPYSWAVVAGNMLPFEPTLTHNITATDVEEPLGSATEEVLRLIDDRLHETLLDAFTHRIDPIIRILHWPTFQNRCDKFMQRRRSQIQMTSKPPYTGTYVQEAQLSAPQSSPYVDPAITNLYSASAGSDKHTATSSDRAFVTLLCAVYYASIISVVHGPNPSDLGQGVNAVGLWSALRREMTSRLNIMDESFVQAASVDLLQAMVLCLSVELGTVNPQRQWLQLGTAIQMAKSLGLHRDPSTFGLYPIDIETRRRLWAQICILDGRVSEQLCREPAIDPDTYDTALPLSLTDSSLSELDLQSRSVHQESDGGFTDYQAKECAQEHAVPFSPMILLLLDAETAREKQQLFCIRYNPRDRPLSANSGSPRFARRASGRADRTYWANELQDRFSSRYSCDGMDTSDPMQYLVTENFQINLLKIQLIRKMTERREMNPYGRSDVLSTFHEALHLATRCANLSHQYSNSPYNWYTRRIRDVYSCSFLALVLSSDEQLSVEDTTAAWSVLNQLFPNDAAQRSTEPGTRETLFEKIVAKARVLRDSQAQARVDPRIGEQSMNPPAGGYPTHITIHPPVTPPAGFEQTPTIQSTGNIFEDWDALAQEQLWPGSLSADNNYWFSYTPSQINNRASYHSQSQPFEQPHALKSHSVSTTPHITTTIILDPQLQPCIAANTNASAREPQLSTPLALFPRLETPSLRWAQNLHPKSPTPSVQVVSENSEINNAATLSRTSTWPAPQDQLQVSPHLVRERSASQPPHAHDPISSSPQMVARKKRATSNIGPRVATLPSVGFMSSNV